MAFNVCVRLGMIQAHIWETLGNAPIYEAPANDTQPPMEADEALEQMIKDMKNSGHTLATGFRGKYHGLARKDAMLFTRIRILENGKGNAFRIQSQGRSCKVKRAKGRTS